MKPYSSKRVIPVLVYLGNWDKSGELGPNIAIMDRDT